MRGRRVTRWRAVLILASVLGVEGCGTFRPPTVRVAEVRLASMNLSGGLLRVSLDVDNPNRYALESRDFRYALAFAEGTEGEPVWVTLAEGIMADTVRVEGAGERRLEVSIPFDVVSAGAALGRLLRQGELEYRFSGALLAGTPLGERRVPFDQRGRFRP